HPPVANSQAVVTSLNQGMDVILSGSDPDGDSLSFIITGPPSHRTLSGTAPNLHYQPNTDFSGSDSIVFKVNDRHVDSARAAVSITVLADASHSLIDVDFGAGQSPGLGQGKVGPAAIGHDTDG